MNRVENIVNGLVNTETMRLKKCPTEIKNGCWWWPAKYTLIISIIILLVASIVGVVNQVRIPDEEKNGSWSNFVLSILIFIFISGVVCRSSACLHLGGCTVLAGLQLLVLIILFAGSGALAFGSIRSVSDA